MWWSVAPSTLHIQSGRAHWWLWGLMHSSSWQGGGLPRLLDARWGNRPCQDGPDAHGRVRWRCGRRRLPGLLLVPPASQHGRMPLWRCRTQRSCHMRRRFWLSILFYLILQCLRCLRITQYANDTHWHGIHRCIFGEHPESGSYEGQPQHWPLYQLEPKGFG